MTLTENKTDTHTEVECYVAAIINIPATQTHTRRASELPPQQMIEIKDIRSGCPEHVSKTPDSPFFPVKSELSEYNGMVTRGNHILVPQTVNILDRIHIGHQGCD